MGGKLKADESLPRGFKRVIGWQIDRVVRRLSGKERRRRGKSIHAARKGLKKIRATLRLVRGPLGDDEWGRQDRLVRKAGRALARWRDAEVLLRTLETLRGQERSHETGAGLVRLQKKLIRKYDKATKGLPAARQKCKARLRLLHERVGDRTLDGLDRDSISRAVGACYEQGLQAFESAERTRAGEDLHEWRKRAKDLWYQLSVLKALHPGALRNPVRAMKRLSQCLGDDHDLVMLEIAARDGGLNARELQALSALVRPRRTKLQRAAFELGRKFYRATPVAFAAPLGETPPARDR